jgi:hypothetical protein
MTVTKPTTFEELNAALTTLLREPDTPTPTPATPGFCYLHLVAVGARPRAISLFHTDPSVHFLREYFSSFPGDFAPGHFTASLHTSIRNGINLVRHATIFPSADGTSRMTAKDLLFCLQDHVTVGGGLNDIAVNVPTNLAPSSASPTTQDVTFNNTASRSVLCVLNGFSTGSKQGSSTVRSVNIANLSAVSAISKPWSSVRVSDVTITINALAACTGYQLSVAWCWTHTSDVPPANTEAVYDRPNSGRLILSPAIPGGFWQPVSLSCPLGRDFISSVIKPAVAVGGSPVWTCIVSAEPLPGQNFKDSVMLTELTVALTISIG